MWNKGGYVVKDFEVEDGRKAIVLMRKFLINWKLYNFSEKHSRKLSSIVLRMDRLVNRTWRDIDEKD